MNTEKKIPDAETRAKNVERLKQVCLRFDYLNMLLEEASILLEADRIKSPLYIHRREQLKKQVEQWKESP